MNIVKACVAIFTGVIGVTLSVPAFAACIAAPYNSSFPPATFTDSISASQNAYLYVNSTLKSSRNASKLTFTSTGRLEYNLRGIRTIWNSGRENCIPSPYTTYYARFQSDGNLVVYWVLSNNPFNLIPIWASNTSGHPNARLVITEQDDLAIYDGSQKIWGISK